jgi:L-iditol 2-dehydrogenase
MKALVLTEYNHLKIDELPIPKIKNDEVLVKVEAVGICGSDVHGIDGSSGRRQPPIVMGHEASGIITELGEAVEGWQLGDRVTFDSTVYALGDWYSRHGFYNLSDGREVLGVSCDDYKRNGAFAEFVAIPAHILYKIPDNVTFEQAAMVEPIAVALHALALSPLAIGDTVIVGGTGMIGLFIIQLLALRGCRKIIAFDLAQDKLDLALQLGATCVLNPSEDDIPALVKSLSFGRGADVGFDVVGIAPVIKTLVESVRKGGHVTLVGNIAKNVEMPLQAIVTKQLRLQGSCAICGEYEQALELISLGKIATAPIISAVAPLEEGENWFKRLYHHEKGLMKVILKP